MLPAETKSATEKLNTLSTKEVIDNLASWATGHKLPFVVYRLPKEDSFSFMIGSSVSKILEGDIASLARGFIVSSYEGDRYFIDQVLSYTSDSGELIKFGNLPSQASIDSIGDNKEVWHPYLTENNTDATAKEEYIENVQRCIDEIQESSLLKVVPSRVKKISLPEDKSLSEIFLNLCESYNNAFVSLLSTPELGTWMGATPETLIELDAQGIFKTMSLAGTQKYDNTQPLHTLPWTEKEIEEQAMVSRFIINRFKEIRLREFDEVGPRTIKAGNLAHLCSTFTVDTIATDYPDLASIMLELLHPTSAVCGMPKSLAEKLIEEIENHPRKLYSGYFGPVNMPEGSHIYVNLRCMEIVKENAFLYAGAGVTAYSIPEDEWHETELKCNTLLNIIKD